MCLVLWSEGMSQYRHIWVVFVEECHCITGKSPLQIYLTHKDQLRRPTTWLSNHIIKADTKQAFLFCVYIHIPSLTYTYKLFHQNDFAHHRYDTAKLIYLKKYSKHLPMNPSPYPVYSGTLYRCLLN